MKNLEKLYQKAGEFHGSICGGIILGVRMACLGCRIIGLDEPKKPENRKKLMVWVEINRCATDGIQSVTGCSLGKRTLKMKDYGIMAATFLNLESEKAIRISVHPDSRQKAKSLFPHLTDDNHVYLEAYKLMSDEDLFTIEEVYVDTAGEDMPGPPPSRTKCQMCGEEVIEGREIKQEGKSLCRHCAHMPLYYSPLRRVNLSEFKNKLNDLGA